MAQAVVYLYYMLTVINVNEADGRMSLCPSIAGRPNDVSLDDDLNVTVVAVDVTGIFVIQKSSTKYFEFL